MILHPARMGQHNKRALVRQLQKLGMASRADLAKSLGMSQPTAGKIVDELLAVKILEEVEIAGNGDHGSARLGRPGRQLQLNRSRSGFLGSISASAKLFWPKFRSGRTMKTAGAFHSATRLPRPARRRRGKKIWARRQKS